MEKSENIKSPPDWVHLNIAAKQSEAMLEEYHHLISISI